MKNTFIEQSQRLLTLETSNQSDEETWPDQQKEDDNGNEYLSSGEPKPIFSNVARGLKARGQHWKKLAGLVAWSGTLSNFHCVGVSGLYKASLDHEMWYISGSFQTLTYKVYFPKVYVAISWCTQQYASSKLWEFIISGIYVAANPAGLLNQNRKGTEDILD